MFDIVWSVNAVEEIKVERSWKERLFSLPWRPFVKYKKSFNPIILQMGNQIIAHPSFKGKLKIPNELRLHIPFAVAQNVEKLLDIGV